MNLHISSPSRFIETFHNNLKEIGVESNNKIVLRSRDKGHYFPNAPLYSGDFERIVGDTQQYSKVFIHQFSPLMYRWVAINKFKELNWMVWGADLYNLPALDRFCYMPITWKQYVRVNRPANDMLYRLKVFLTNSFWKASAYKKINKVLTWMPGEYAFAKAKLPIDQAAHSFFFYENNIPYEKLDTQIQKREKSGSDLTLLLGNSASPSLNHLEVLNKLNNSQANINLIVPISYGDKKYGEFLRQRAKNYRRGQVQFIDAFMSFDAYLNLLNSVDGLIMNNIRAQGYGNVFMMMYLGKPVFLNELNISLPDLKDIGFKWYCLSDLMKPDVFRFNESNRNLVKSFFSHEKLLSIYSKLFA